jgi:hypothetical protein
VERLFDLGTGWLGWLPETVAETAPWLVERAFAARVECLEATNEMWARAKAKRGTAHVMPPKPQSEDALAARIARSLRAHPNYVGTR